MLIVVNIIQVALMGIDVVGDASVYNLEFKTMKKLLLILLTLSFIFTQEPCEDYCLSQEEMSNIINDVDSLKFNLDKQIKMNENLNEQIYIYIQHDDLNKRKSILLNDKINLYEDLVKQVKPKWYENKWLWFSLGVVFTAGSVKLAGELVD